jgi:polyisoprenoid-binding protein YceI
MSASVDTARNTVGVGTPPPGRWYIDPLHSNVGFIATHLGFARVRGRFGDVVGTVHIGHDLTETTAQLRISAAGIDTGVAMRDEHLRSPEFFDVTRHPVITFRGFDVHQHADHYTMDGELTILGTTRPVVVTGWYCGEEAFPLTGGRRLGFTGRATVDRRDFGLTALPALPAAEIFIGNKVDIELDISMVDHDISTFVRSVLGHDPTP